MFQKKWNLIALLIVVALLLAACGGPAATFRHGCLLIPNASRRTASGKGLREAAGAARGSGSARGTVREPPPLHRGCPARCPRPATADTRGTCRCCHDLPDLVPFRGKGPPGNCHGAVLNDKLSRHGCTPVHGRDTCGYGRIFFCIFCHRPLCRNCFSYHRAVQVSGSE